jgi:hypothetical protein
MSGYAQNSEKVRSLVTRNEENIIEIEQSSFWINDVKQDNNQFKVQIAFESIQNWLKIVQEQGGKCLFCPIDGNDGVFRKGNLIVQNSSRFVYNWATENGVEEKNAGDCDCLLVDNKWHFLEFKTDATSIGKNQMDNNRNKGEAQLAKTMTAFKEGLDDVHLPCVCVLVVPKVYPKTPASLINRGLKFRNRFDKKVQLIEISNDGNNHYSLR